MKTAHSKIKWIFRILTFLLLSVVLLVRFTDGTISIFGKILLGYDEKDERFQVWEKRSYHLTGVDGPYIIRDTLYEVGEDRQLHERAINRNDTLWVKIDHTQQERFSLRLKDSLPIENDQFAMPDKLIAISDIEGNFDALAGFLVQNDVIDTQYNWIFGNGHLLLNGDFVDRGEHVTQVLWLIYKLENQAISQNGRVHYILGNHEILNFQGNATFNHEKYKRIGQLISKNDTLKIGTQLLYSHHSELGRWLRKKNIMEKIGNYIFVHAGLSPDLLKFQVSISDINQIARNNWDTHYYDTKQTNTVEQMITGKHGVYWYRGLAIEHEGSKKITESELDQILSYYAANKIVFGHTVVADITQDFGGKAINIDVKHGKEKYSNKTKGILIEKGIAYKIDAKGNQTLIR